MQICSVETQIGNVTSADSIFSRKARVDVGAHACASRPQSSQRNSNTNVLFIFTSVLLLDAAEQLPRNIAVSVLISYLRASLFCHLASFSSFPMY